MWNKAILAVMCMVDVDNEVKENVRVSENHEDEAINEDENGKVNKKEWGNESGMPNKGEVVNERGGRNMSEGGNVSGLNANVVKDRKANKMWNKNEFDATDGKADGA